MMDTLYYSVMHEWINISFHGQLNDLLPLRQRQQETSFKLHKARSVKDLVESIGIPHTEIDVILVDEQSVDFNHQLVGGESIQVYPANHSIDKISLTHNQPEIPADRKFVLDVHLGRLAVYCRLLGFDTLYRNDYDDPTLADISADQNRILLTCDRRLLMRKKVSLGYLVRSREPRQQILELVSRYDLLIHPTQVVRCLECNGIIHAVKKQQIEDQLQPLTKEHYQEFYQCDRCQKIYWRGSHYTKMQALIKTIKKQAS